MVEWALTDWPPFVVSSWLKTLSLDVFLFFALVAVCRLSCSVRTVGAFGLLKRDSQRGASACGPLVRVQGFT